MQLDVELGERGRKDSTLSVDRNLYIWSIYDHICIYERESNDTLLWLANRVRGREMAEALRKQQRGLLSHNQKPRTCFLVRPRTRLKAHRLASQWGLKIIHNYLKSQFSHLKECQLKKSAADLIGWLERKSQSDSVHPCSRLWPSCRGHGQEAVCKEHWDSADPEEKGGVKKSGLQEKLVLLPRRWAQGSEIFFNAKEDLSRK